MSDFLNVIERRNSVRKYQDKDLSEEQIRTLVEAGLRAPTAANKQEIHFTVVKKDNAAQAELANDHKPGATVPFYFNAPVVIYLSADESFSWSGVDAGIAIENIHLAAEAMGLGSVILGCVRDILNGEKKAYYAEKFAFPDGYKFEVAIAVGYAEAVKEQHTFEYDRDVSIV
ncbi:MAG: nitroreductase family protein [Oscillospiraceae bacterium]|nr:nitroreductase family protein [Oscillospiraceae bacterium]